MNVLLSCVGKRGYIADYFREQSGKAASIYGTSNTRWTPGFSRCDAAFLLPDIRSRDYVPRLIELCGSERVSLLLSFFDPDVSVLSGHRQDFARVGTMALIPGPVATEAAFDKFATYNFLSSLGVRTPRTFTDLNAAELSIASGDLRLPVYVKPRFGFGSALTFQAGNMEQLRVFFGLGENMIVQECVSGRFINADALLDDESRVLSIVPWERHLSSHGETERATTIEHYGVIEMLAAVLPALGAVGPVDVDMYESSDGGLGILEINLRFGGGYPVSHLAGANFPAKILQIARGERVEACVDDYERGVVMMKRLEVIGGPESTFFTKNLQLRQ